MTSSLVPNNKSKQLLDKQYASEPTLFSANKVIHTNPLLLNTHSLPNLTSSSSLVDVTEDYVFSRQDLTAAAEILINIVNESQFILSTSQFKKTLKKNLAVSDRVLSLVYGTMKYLTYIDTILVKTQFLVYHTQFLNALGLVKIIMYLLMKHNFEMTSYGSLFASLTKEDPEKNSGGKVDLDAQEFQDLYDAIKAHNVKLSAAFARIRIEKMATGATFAERMENILPTSVRQLESLAGELPKTVRVNISKTSIDLVLDELTLAGIPVSVEPKNREEVYSDEDFKDLLIVSTENFNRLKAIPLFTEGMIVYQDKASMFAPRHIVPHLKKSDKVVDARAGCGTRVCYLSSLLKQATASQKRIVKKKNKPEELIVPKIFAFENRTGRLETLKARIVNQNEESNVEVVENNFLSSDPKDPKYAEVTCIIVEPPNSGTAIMDKLGYLLQEEEFPNEQYTHKDILSFKQSQVSWLKHAFKFPNVRNVVYITRSCQNEENNEVVEELLERYAVEWDLECIFPDRVMESSENYQYEECLMIPPTQNGNGIFIAHFQKMDKEETPAASESEEEDEEDEMLEIPLAAEGNKTAMTESAKKKKKIQKKVMMKPRNRFDLPEPRVIQRKVYHIKTTYTYDDDEEEEQEGGAAAYKNNGKGVFSRSSNNIRVFRGQESGAQGHQQQNTTKFSKRGVPRHVEERLSMLSLKSNSSASENEDGSKHGRKKFNRKRASKKEGTRRGGNGDSDDDGNDDEDDDEAAARNMSLGLYGIGLKRFYAPQFHAMAQLKKKAELAAAAAAGRDAKALYNSTSLDEPMRWRYPVPNPMPWK